MNTAEGPQPTDTNILITLTADGQINVNCQGPGADNKITVLGILEFAKAVIATPQQLPPPGPRLAIPNGHRIPNLRGG